MNVSELFIKRPVMTSLVMAAFLFAGLFGYFSLPVNELPNVDFPTIVVSASLPGADAETMASSVATPLEGQFSLIAGLDTMSSTNVLGDTQITLQFRLDRNIDAAAQDVQSALAAAARQLPANMPAPPTMRKVNPTENSIFQLTITSPTLPLSTVDEYAETIIVRSISSIDGVANVDIFGQAHPAVRIELDPDALAVRGIGVDQVAIAEAALIRFRPIMMTTMAALMGSLPIALGLGQGGSGRQPLGLAVVGGLIFSQALTLYITPVIYGTFDRLGVRVGRALNRNVSAPAE